MPCYDKKLEASRSDFYNSQYATRDVDCVLTTGELLLLAREHNVDLSLPVPDEDAPPSPTSPTATPVIPDLLTPPGSSSGSYLYSLILTIACTYPHPLTLESKAVRSADYVEYTLRDSSSGAPVFRGATCYGFRNLQNVVRRVGRAAGVQVGRGAAGRLAGGLHSGGAAKRTAAVATGGAGAVYDYVEVMACPGGCVGGGGQLRAPERKTQSTEDAEGFVRDWADGVRIQPDRGPGQEGHANGGTTAEASPPWSSSRAWTREVERAYWGGGPAPQLELEHALPTPPASPVPAHRDSGAKAAGYDTDGAKRRERRRREGGERGGGASSSSQRLPPRGEPESVVETLITRALRELCMPVLWPPPPLAPEQQEGGARSDSDYSWEWSMSTSVTLMRMDEAAEARRSGFFRTEYRAVESDVVGLGVKW